MQRGSTDAAIFKLLEPGCWSRSPLSNRLHLLPSDLPLFFAYGERDYMDIRCPSDWAKENTRNAELYVVPKATHEYWNEIQTMGEIVVGYLTGKKGEIEKYSYRPEKQKLSDEEKENRVLEYDIRFLKQMLDVKIELDGNSQQ